MEEKLNAELERVSADNSEIGDWRSKPRQSLVGGTSRRCISSTEQHSDNSSSSTHVLNTALATCYPVAEQATQAGPSPPLHPFQCYESPGRSELRTEIIDQFHDLLAMYVHGDSVALHDLADDLLSGKKWSNTFGGPGKKQDGKADSKFLSSLVEEYQECKRKETNSLIQKQSQKLKQAINISRTLSNSQIAFQGNTPQNFNTRIDAAYSLGRLTTYSAERWGVLSIVAADYP